MFGFGRVSFIVKEPFWVSERSNCLLSGIAAAGLGCFDNEGRIDN